MICERKEIKLDKFLELFAYDCIFFLKATFLQKSGTSTKKFFGLNPSSLSKDSFGNPNNQILNKPLP